VYNQFTIRCAQRDELREFLKRAGIPTEIYYPGCLHLQPAFAYLGFQPGQFPKAERASAEVLSLPVYPELQPGQQEVVVRTVAEFYASQTESLT
jgi:dTDP-4-amino-4,6-dideoxygalactose transaminase